MLPSGRILTTMIIPKINKIHINYSAEKASDGSTIRESIMVNIHEEDVVTAVKLYQELRERLEANPEATKAIKVQPFPECPVHKVKMLLRTKRTDNSAFFGCPFYASKGCQQTISHQLSH